MKLQRNLPLSEQITLILKDKIMSGEYLPGVQIPSESEISKELEVSRATVRTAMASLVSEGLVIKKQGLGTFVAPNSRLESGIEKLESVITMAQRQGKKASPTELCVQSIPVNTRIANFLNIPEGTFVTNVQRIILVDGERVSYQDDYTLPKWLEVDDIDEKCFTGSVLDTLQKKHTPFIDRSIAEFTAVHPSQKLMNLLDVSMKAPLILLKETLYSIDGDPMCFSDNYFIPERFCWQVVRR